MFFLIHCDILGCRILYPVFQGIINRDNVKSFLELISINCINTVNRVNPSWVIQLEKGEIMFFFFDDEAEYNPFLCMGTFFTLLIGSLKPRSGSRLGFNKEHTDGMSNGDVFYELQRIADPSLERPTTDSYQTVISNLKNCKISNTEYFDKEHLYKYLNNRLSGDNEHLYSDTNMFLTRFIEGGTNNTTLASTLIWLISASRKNYEPVNGYKPIVAGIYDVVDQWENSGKATVSLPHLFLFCLIAVFNPTNNNKDGEETILYWKKQFKDEKNTINELSDPIKDSIMLGKRQPVSFQLEKTEIPTINIMPELTAENAGNIFLVANRPSHKIIPSDSGPFSKYLNKAIDEFSEIKTLLYKDVKKPFYDFYIPNDLSNYSRGRMQIEDIIDIMPTSEHISSLHQTKTIITGIGGAGKSMMMHHIFMQAARRYENYGTIPVLIELKHYKNNNLGILDLIKHSINLYDADVSESEIEESLGQMILLFDGLDEIASDLRDDFLNKLINYHRNNDFDTIVLSSRPYSDFVQLRNFDRFDISPFTKEQSIAMIEKLDFQSDTPEFKAQFLEALKTKLYRTHREFVSNPLLLTIMLMTYHYNGDISSSTYGFYQEAYETLIKTHDATKAGFKRKMKTQLDSNEFSKILSAFCALSFINNCYDYTPSEIDEYWQKANSISSLDDKIKTSDFIHDIVNNVCLMFYEAGSYHYIHRSFQEYFSAVYFSRCEDSKLIGLARFADKCGNQSGAMLDMLYSMIPEKIEKYVFYPYLKKLETQLTDNKYYDETYFNYLCLMYPVLYSKDGETEYSVTNKPRFYFYDFLTSKKRIQRRLDTYSMPIIEDFEEKRWYYGFSKRTMDTCNELSDDMLELLEYDDIPSYCIDLIGDPEYAGAICAYEMDSILESYNCDPEEYDIKDVMETITDDNFALKVEFNSVMEYIFQLKKKFASNSENDDAMYGLF